MNSDPLRAYRQTRVTTASQGKLIVMLYDEGLKQLRIAGNELGSPEPKFDAAHNAIVRAQDIVTELMVSLDFDRGGDIARNLFHLYMYFNQRLAEANMSKNPEGTEVVYNLMSDLREAWAAVEGTAESAESGFNGGVNLAG